MRRDRDTTSYRTSVGSQCQDTHPARLPLFPLRGVGEVPIIFACDAGAFRCFNATEL